MSEISFKCRVLSAKFIDVEVIASRTTVNVGLLNRREAKKLLLEIEDFRSSLLAFLDENREHTDEA
jgi:hypothetical protein